MKLKPTIYAKLLIESIKDQTDIKKLSAGFWRFLQKNNQYKDLAKILDELELEYARKNGKVLAKVYSEEVLTKSEIKEIEDKIVKKIGRKVIISNICKKNWGGVTVEVEDRVIDLSSKGKIERLKQKLTT